MSAIWRALANCSRKGVIPDASSLGPLSRLPFGCLRGGEGMPLRCVAASTPNRLRSEQQMAVIAKRKASHQVADALCGMLRSGSYRVGDRMPSEFELGAALGVSRSTVREAVRELTSLGVLEIQHGRGTFVRSLRPDLLRRGGSLLVDQP